MALVEQDRGGRTDDASQEAADRTVARRDVFISHASEDKDALARPLAQRLRADGCSVWFDEYELVLGDSLRTQIGDGLRHSQVGVVILSRSFFAKRWARWELDGLTARHIAGEQNVILPVWHEVGLDDVRAYSPPLADLFAAKSSDGVEAVADCVVRVLSKRAAGGAPRAALSAGAHTPRRHRYLTPKTLRGALSIAVALIAIAALLTGTHPFGDGRDGQFVSSSTPGSRAHGGAACSAARLEREASNAWYCDHPADHVGPVWIQVNARGRGLGRGHTVTVQWGPLIRRVELPRLDEKPVTLVHRKTAPDAETLHVEVKPAAVVTFGQGPPPDPPDINIDKGWTSSADWNLPASGPPSESARG